MRLVVSEGDVVRVVEEDDGSGWVKVDDGSGGKGLVPASYVQLTETAPQHGGHVSPSGPTGSGRPQGSGKYGNVIGLVLERHMWLTQRRVGNSPGDLRLSGTRQRRDRRARGRTRRAHKRNVGRAKLCGWLVGR